MKIRTLIIILIVAVVAVGGGYLGYKAYQKYVWEHQIISDVATEPVEVPSPTIRINRTNELAEPNEPEYKDVTADGESLYPSLSGVYEPIWDDYESIPIDILAEGSSTLSASYKIIWAKRYLYIQVTVNDATPDTSGENYGSQDSVEIFINEDGNKNSTLLVGDAHYIINRDNTRFAGFGASTGFESVTYELDPVIGDDGSISSTGYVVEAIIPFLTIKASKNESIGFDIQVNDAVGGQLVSIYKWASDYIYTFQNFSAVGTLTFK